MRYLPATLVLASILLVAPKPAGAWNKAGHMVSGAIAFSELKASDPEAVKQVVALLKTLPEYRRLWLPAIKRSPVGLRNHDLYLFMFAARWPDDMRDNPNIHCGSCHFINYGFKPDGQPDSVIVKDPLDVNVEKTFDEKLAIVRDANSTPLEKAMALAWIFHVVGDVHQPLHTSALFTTQFPNGDLGGNLFFIRTTSTANTTNLHSFWDGLVITSEGFVAVRDKANELRLRDSLKRAALRELAEKDFHDWSKDESFSAAKIHAYRMGALVSGADKDHGEVLPRDYRNVNKPLAERRMILAGYRLADILKDTF